jgi:Ni,Fe-hydrogenase III component G
MDEEKIIQVLTEKLGSLPEQAMLKRPRRISVVVPLDKLRSALQLLVEQQGFNGLSTITGMDAGDNFEIIYHLSREGSIMLNLKVLLPKTNAKINTLTDLFPVAEMYEREMEDLLGLEVVGLKTGRRYPLPDNWPKDAHPLLKHWKAGNNE